MNNLHKNSVIYLKWSMVCFKWQIVNHFQFVLSFTRKQNNVVTNCTFILRPFWFSDNSNLNIVLIHLLFSTISWSRSNLFKNIVFVRIWSNMFLFGLSPRNIIHIQFINTHSWWSHSFDLARSWAICIYFKCMQTISWNWIFIRNKRFKFV